MDAVTHALVVRRPWIDLILEGRKSLELRSRATSRRGWIALIPGRSGLVAGVVRLAGCTPPLNLEGLRETASRHCVPEDDWSRMLAQGWRIGWELEDAHRLPRPVPYRHPLGAVTWVRLQPDVAQAVAVQVLT